MKIVPPNISRLMSPEDRKKLGITTPEESIQRAEAQSEKELQQQICALLNRRGIPYIRPAMFKKSSLPKGWPDLTFVLDGIPYAWECKAEKGRLSAEQDRMLFKLMDMGWKTQVIRRLSQAQDILG